MDRRNPYRIPEEKDQGIAEYTRPPQTLTAHFTSSDFSSLHFFVHPTPSWPPRPAPLPRLLSALRFSDPYYLCSILRWYHVIVRSHPSLQRFVCSLVSNCDLCL